MNKIVILICATLFIALYACDERDDLRSDINDLKEWVTDMEAGIEQMNTDINSYQQMVAGKVFVSGYEQDELGNYTIRLTNGESLSIYSGEVDMNDMPLFGINAAGNWTYTINGVTNELLVNNKPVCALGQTGSGGISPKVRVDAEGYWQVSTDDGSTWSRLGNNQIADGTKAVATISSVFSNVVVDASSGQIVFTIRADGNQVAVDIYGQNFYLNISYDGRAEFRLSQMQTFPVEQANVETVVIENQTWGVRLEENKLTVTAPMTNPRGVEYDDLLYLKIFSKEGFCKMVKLPVRLMITE